VYQTEAGIVLCPASRPAKTPLTPVYIGCLSSIVESPHEFFHSVFPLDTISLQLLLGPGRRLPWELEPHGLAALGRLGPRAWQRARRPKINPAPRPPFGG
jgi:hypothetical protein